MNSTFSSLGVAVALAVSSLAAADHDAILGDNGSHVVVYAWRPEATQLVELTLKPPRTLAGNSAARQLNLTRSCYLSRTEAKELSAFLAKLAQGQKDLDDEFQIKKKELKCRVVLARGQKRWTLVVGAKPPYAFIGGKTAALKLRRQIQVRLDRLKADVIGRP